MEPIDIDLTTDPIVEPPMLGSNRWSQRTVELASSLSGHKLTMLCAPAGFGKSVVLSNLRQLLEEAGDKVAFLKLDKRDDDIARFLRRVAEVLEIEGAPGSTDELAELVERREGEAPCYLFIDSLHEVGTAVMQAVSDLLSFTEPLRIVLAAREPNLPGLSKLRAGDQLSLIGPDQLSLTRAEALTYLALVPDGAILALIDRCNGWPMLLKLVKMGLDAGDTPDIAGELGSVSADLIADFLEEDILAWLPPDDRDFLEGTSVVSRFTIDLAQMLLPDARAEESIGRLTRRSGLLVPRRLNGLWFHVNDLLRAALLRRIRARMGSAIQDIHRNVETWMIAHDAADEAVLHACLAEDYEECVDLVRRFGPAALSMRYGLRTFRSVLSAVPRHYLDREPSFGVSEALVLSKEGRTGDARRLIRRLRDARDTTIGKTSGAMGDLDLLDIMLTCQADQPPAANLVENLEKIAARQSPTDLVHQGWVQNLLCRVHLSAGNLTAAAAAGIAAERYYAKSESRYGQFFIHLHLASTRGWQGLADEAANHIDSAETIAVHYFSEDPNMADMSRLLRAEMRFERGEEDLGIALLPALQTAENNDGWLDLFVSGYRTAARYAYRGGNLENALAILRRGEEVAVRTGFDRLDVIMQILRVEFLTFAGRRTEAGTALRSIRLGRSAEDAARWRERLLRGIATARLLVHSRQFKRASTLLDTLEAECATRGVGSLILKVRLLNAILLSCSGSPQRAISAFISVLQSDQPLSLLQSYVEEGELMARLCVLASHSAQRHGLAEDERALVERISEKLGETGEYIVDRDAGAAAYLSDREREILLSLAHGESNKSTAARFNLSEATVKFHLQRIYRKLGVHNRVKALAVAQREGLLY